MYALKQCCHYFTILFKLKKKKLKFCNCFLNNFFLCVIPKMLLKICRNIYNVSTINGVVGLMVKVGSISIDEGT